MNESKAVFTADTGNTLPNSSRAYFWTGDGCADKYMVKQNLAYGDAAATFLMQIFH